MNAPDETDIAALIAVIIAGTAALLLMGWLIHQAIEAIHQAWQRRVHNLWRWVPEPARARQGFVRAAFSTRDVEYELTTAAPRPVLDMDADAARGGEIREARAREIAGMPAWRLKQLLCLEEDDINGIAEYARWQGHFRTVMDRLLQVEAMLQRKREKLVVYGSARDLPKFLQLQAD